MKLQYPNAQVQSAVFIAHDHEDSSRFRVRTLPGSPATQAIDYDSRGFALTGTTWLKTYPPLRTAVNLVLKGSSHPAEVVKLLEHAHFEVRLEDETYFDSESFGRLGIQLRFLRSDDIRVSSTPLRRNSSFPAGHSTFPPFNELVLGLS